MRHDKHLATPPAPDPAAPGENHDVEAALRQEILRLTKANDDLRQQLLERTQEIEHVLEQKSALLHELDHRVKNNLQLMISLVGLELRGTGHPGIRDTLKRLRGRLQALGTVHHNRYSLEDIHRFDASDFVRTLAEELTMRPAFSHLKVDLDLTPVPVELPMASPLALLLNEMVWHEITLTASDATEPRMDIRVMRDSGSIVFELVRYGDSLVPDIMEKDSEELVSLLSCQLSASLERLDGQGARGIRLRLPNDSDRPGGGLHA